MKKYVLALSLLATPLWAATIAVDQQPAEIKAAQAPQKADPKDALVQELISVMKVNDATEKSMHQMIDSLAKTLPPQKDPEARKGFEGFMGRLKEKVPHIMETAKKAMIPLYKKHYSEADLKAQVAFYKTSAGKKSIEAMPKAMAFVGQIMTAMMNPQAKMPEAPVLDEKDAFTQQILELAKVMKIERTLDDVKKGIDDLDKVLKDAPKDAPEQQIKFVKMQQDQMKKLHGHMVKMLKPLFAKNVRENYTLDDVKALIAFYQTDAGKRTIEATPHIQKDMQPIFQQMMQKLMMDLMQQQGGLPQASKAKA